jgi:hypothetical protein
VVVEPFARLTCALKRLTPGLLDFFFHLGRRKRMAKKAARLAPECAATCGPAKLQVGPRNAA